MSNALIIIDVQNAFLKGGELQVCDNVNDILPEINKLQNNTFFDHIIVTQHVYPTKKFVNRDTLVFGTYGAKLNEIIDKNKINLLITKQTYSAFCTNNDLLNYLILNNIQNLYLCGLAYDWCVKDTALLAKQNRFNVKIIKNAVKSYNSDTENQTDLLMMSIGVNLIDCI